MIRDILSKVTNEYPTAIDEPFTQHPIAQFMRRNIPLALAKSRHFDGFIVAGSPGKGQWTSLPWIAFFDPAVTDSAQQGYYVVYLFSEDFSTVHLSLNQGTHAVREEFKSLLNDVLKSRAEIMRFRLEGQFQRLSPGEIKVTNDSRLHGYEVGHALGRTYNAAALPSEDELLADLLEALRLYRILILRGGASEASLPEYEHSTPQTIEEQRKYSSHLAIERNSKVSDKVKKYHGHTCQVCSFNFAEYYGDIGQDFIEAHHLVPLSSLNEGERISMDIAKDFAVLCSNCHRMAHKRIPPFSTNELRALLRRDQ